MHLVVKVGKATNKVKYPKRPPFYEQFIQNSLGDSLSGWEVVISIVASLAAFADLVESFTIEESGAKYYALEEAKEQLCTTVVDAANSVSSIWNSVVDPGNSSADRAPSAAMGWYRKVLKDTSLPEHCNEIKRNLQQPWERATRDGTIRRPTDLGTYKDRLQQMMPKIQEDLKKFLELEISNGLIHQDTALLGIPTHSLSVLGFLPTEGKDQAPPSQE
ncbi:uncharacterized protein PV07_07947 [Cladophialophora immunda]|uniref:Uncharacterized protein n=1 Tax=Cladophialophora immunda TaxID=569365 RepID=A0A0D2CXB6_9EURO|nr:uncharacterized protein PV07_07947 [Cladophialophora immunda]KIW28269.1 hypothetical protein PV07_07947 [Cladophialophora immunda]